MPTISQHSYDVIEIAALGVSCLVSFVTLIYVIKYTRRTTSIAESTARAADEAAQTARITEQSVEISSRMVEEMRETRDAQIAPYVFAYFDQMKGKDATKIFLVIKNAGAGQAKDVRVKFEPELQNAGDYSLKHIRRLTEYIPSLPPGGEIRHAFALTVTYFKAQPPLPKKYKVHTTFYGGAKKDERKVEQVISLDFFSGRRSNRVEEKGE
ncbi:MAG TPA: hypothetical protein VF717_03020 [Pyrinomonadaceae bacterium]|jgi:mannitol-specific phosphotransferase system IIBC component